MPYFHLVFTLPHALNGLIAAAPRRLYKTLFAAVSATLGEFAGSRRHLGGVPAFSLVLHTWKQDLGRHVHLHALVAGGALAPSGEWTGRRRGSCFRCARSRRYSAVSSSPRSNTCARPAGCPRTSPVQSEWQRLRSRLYARDWVVYAKEPLGGPAAVLDYLGRYTLARYCG